MSLARMSDGDRPGPHCEPGPFADAAEIEVVEVKTELRVKRHARVPERFHPRRQEDAVQQLRRAGGLSVPNDLWGAVKDVRDGAGEVLPGVPGERGIDF